jgi:hypothetical protein
MHGLVETEIKEGHRKCAYPLRGELENVKCIFARRTNLKCYKLILAPIIRNYVSKVGGKWKRQCTK